ncbi:MAG: AAA family ATPase [Acidimicrobiia bacterium]|nr:AAA family ATPase [Acidimicrobiia bacterium]
MKKEIEEHYATLRSNLIEHFTGSGRLAVVKAPPGSGKTYTLIEVLAELAGLGQRIAVAAQINSQADDICHRFDTDHPEVETARFSRMGSLAPTDFPTNVAWLTATAELPASPGVTVATTAKWSLTDIGVPFDLLAIDEAWQMSWADLMQCALLSERFLMIGDPGQIPPVVTIDVRRWETSPRAPHEAAPDVVLVEPSLGADLYVGTLPACRRLPHEAVEFVRPVYDFDFHAFVEPGARGLDLPADHALGDLRDGCPLVLTVPTPGHGPPLEVDQELAEAVSAVISQLLTPKSIVRLGSPADPGRPLAAGDIGVSSSHRSMNSAVAKELAVWNGVIRVDTPERWQGLERPMMIVVHPLSGVVDPTAFDLETGRLCVMASRHQAGLVVLARDHVDSTPANFVPSASQAPGRPDIVGRGHDAHIQFWYGLQNQGRIRPFN